MVFFGFVFLQVFLLLWFVFGVSGIVPTVLKILVFPSLFGGAFVGWLILVYLGLEGLGVFVFLLFVFLFCVAFVSVLFALCLFCLLDCFGCWFLFCCFVVFFCDVFVFLFFWRV